ncbi:MAG: heparinase II/III family protein [Opitutaceae bacterium]|nr:heparinase II/III family protein [Opitutaceae bacterium]
MATPQTFAALKATVARGGLPARIYTDLRTSADEILAAPVSKYEKPDGKRLLSVSRRVLDRVRTLALVYQLEGDARCAERAWQELAAAARFPDWNPAHFLDTAEMTHAFALGYDWLYDRWTDEQRRVLREAIVTKGLREGMKVYESGKGWAKNENNWNQVCNGGLISGALAIADHEPKLAARIVREAVQSVPLAMEHYAPDGAGTEGATYWGYGSRYNIVLLSSLETALGTDFGLKRVGAFGESGYYQIYMSGAGRVAFDFADCGRAKVSEAQHLWLARAYDVPAFSWYRVDALESGGQRGGALDLLWLDERGRGMDFKSLPLDRYFRGAECASMRSSWEPDAIMLGIQAGDSMNLGGHRHLDLGSFVLDALGERWIMDSGVEHETYMAHRHKNPRHAYYRVRAEGHNVPVLNPAPGPDQNPKAVAKIVRFDSTPQQAVAVVDLTQAYDANASRALRTFALADRKRLVITDELEARQPAELWWFLHTEAQVKLSDGGRTATLGQRGKSFKVRLQEPAGAAFTVMDAAPLPSSPNPSPQADNRGRRKLALHLSGVQATRIKVVLEP